VKPEKIQFNGMNLVIASGTLLIILFQAGEHGYNGILERWQITLKDIP
jgi:hypothetical protein